jgi:hypothetical protein
MSEDDCLPMRDAVYTNDDDSSAGIPDYRSPNFDLGVANLEQSDEGLHNENDDRQSLGREESWSTDDDEEDHDDPARQNDIHTARHSRSTEMFTFFWCSLEMNSSNIRCLVDALGDLFKPYHRFLAPAASWFGLPITKGGFQLKLPWMLGVNGENQPSFNEALANDPSMSGNTCFTM